MLRSVTVVWKTPCGPADDEEEALVAQVVHVQRVRADDLVRIGRLGALLPPQQPIAVEHQYLLLPGDLPRSPVGNSSSDFSVMLRDRPCRRQTWVGQVMAEV
jgi:hypothetical protein